MDSLAIAGFTIAFLGLGIVAVYGMLITLRNRKDVGSFTRGYLGLILVTIGNLLIQASRLLGSGEGINPLSVFRYLGLGSVGLVVVIMMMFVVRSIMNASQRACKNGACGS